jgi:hypothetical protein
MTINRIRADRHAWLAGALALCCVTATAAAQEPTVEVDGDEITIRGCVLEGNQTAQAHPVLVSVPGLLKTLVTCSCDLIFMAACC